MRPALPGWGMGVVLRKKFLSRKYPNLQLISSKKSCVSSHNAPRKKNYPNSENYATRVGVPPNQPPPRKGGGCPKNSFPLNFLFAILESGGSRWPKILT